jgi:hypothetical protein
MVLALLAFGGAASGLVWVQITRQNLGKKVFVPIGFLLCGAIIPLHALPSGMVR